MTGLLSVTPLGLAAFVSASDPTDSEVGAKVKDLFVNSASGDHFVCIADTFGSQQWQRTSDGVIFPDSVLASTNPNLVAWYTMDNISGSTLNDESLNANNGTITGPTQVAGQIGNALNYVGGFSDNTPGADDRAIFTGTGVTSSSWSVSCWYSHNLIGFTGAAGSNGNCYLFDLSSPRTIAHIESGAQGNSLRVFNGSSWVVSSQPGARASLTHIVFSYDSSVPEMKIYINGSLTDTLSGTFGGLGDSAWAIGSRYAESPAGYWNSLNGKIDQFRLFNRALTQPEAATLANEV